MHVSKSAVRPDSPLAAPENFFSSAEEANPERSQLVSVSPQFQVVRSGELPPQQKSVVRPEPSPSISFSVEEITVEPRSRELSPSAPRDRKLTQRQRRLQEIRQSTQLLQQLIYQQEARTLVELGLQ